VYELSAVRAPGDCRVNRFPLFARHTVKSTTAVNTDGEDLNWGETLIAIARTDALVGVKECLCQNPETS
jgi:hypothetical protein